MKPFCIFIIVFFMMGICSVAAQDMIVLRDGNMIEAKVTEISPTEIRYKRLDNLEGPTIVVPADNVLSIRYENGTYEIINANSETNTQAESPQTATTAMAPDKTTFAFNINPAGSALYGSSMCFEFTKGKFNTEINLIFPGLGWMYTGGFGGLITFNYFGHSQIGGGYIGFGIGLTYAYYGGSWDSHDEDWSVLTFGLNAGYKFLTESGLYFRTGAYIGVGYDIVYRDSSIYFKPDLAIGYSF